MGGQGMSKYEEITLVLVIQVGLCLAVVAFKTDLKYSTTFEVRRTTDAS
jgi:hypothetical protein